MDKTNLSTLFQGAQNDGILSPAGMSVLAIPDMGAQIQAAIGISVDDVPASEVTLVTILLDDSGSIRFVMGNAEAVRSGCNLLIDSLMGSKQKDGILAHCRYLNGKVLYPFTSLTNAIKLDTTNYDPNGGTPLYDQTAIILGTVLAKAQEFQDAGVPCRTVTVIVTDGADAGSTKHRSGASVAPLVRDMLKTEMHIIAGMGINDGQTDFRRVFGEMGIQKEWILTPGNSPSEIRKAFAVVSQSAVRASQVAGGNLSQVAAGGFGG